MRKILTTLASVVAVLAAQTSSHAAQTFDGLWATSRKDCRDKDGPDSKTFIDLDNVIKGKPTPLVDQYENHCRVDRQTPASDGLVLTTTCFEFWDDYNKGANGRKVTIKLSPGANDTLRIDGKPYLLCKRRSELPKKQKSLGVLAGVLRLNDEARPPLGHDLKLHDAGAVHLAHSWSDVERFALHFFNG